MKPMSVILLGSVLLTIASHSYADQISDTYRNGIREAEKYNNTNAITYFKEVISLTEKDVTAFFKSKGKIVVMEGNTFTERVLQYNVDAHEALGKLYLRQFSDSKDAKLYTKGVKEIKIACNRGSSRACSARDALDYQRNTDNFALMKKALRDRRLNKSDENDTLAQPTGFKETSDNNVLAPQAR